MSDLEKALHAAGYVALPLPRKAADPTTIFAFTDGHLYIVRNPHTCLPNPPVEVTEDDAVDVVQFDREFGLEMKGVVGLFAKLLGIGDAKVQLDAKDIRSARVRMGGLAHVTIQTGAMVEYLLTQGDTPCTVDLYEKSHLTIVAALRAHSFTYKFLNRDNLTVQFALPEVEQLFQVDGSVKVVVLTNGEVKVEAPRYVGVVTWDGAAIAREVGKARQSIQRRGGSNLQVTRPLEGALRPSDVEHLRIASIGNDVSDAPSSQSLSSGRR
jgi:hypothetical protein